MKKTLSVCLIVTTLCSFNYKTTFKGVWEYAGGIYNAKREAPSKAYKLQREYTDSHYDASFIEEGEKPVIYERGEYVIKQDTCLETQSYSKQPSKVIGVTVKYTYRISNDTLKFSGKLPKGTVVQEFWKKVK